MYQYSLHKNQFEKVYLFECIFYNISQVIGYTCPSTISMMDINGRGLMHAAANIDVVKYLAEIFVYTNLPICQLNFGLLIW